MTSPPTRIRLTISVPAEVHAVYRRMAEASGRSIGLEMGEWLAETLAAAEHMTGLLEQVRKAPHRAVEHIQDFTKTLGQMERIRRDASREEAMGEARPASGPRSGTGAGRATAAVSPPSSNTGGKPQKQTKLRSGS